MLEWMSTLLNIFPFITKLPFRGRALMKINFGNKNNQNLVFFFLINQKTDVLNSEKRGNTDLSMPNKIASQTGGETLQPMSIELHVYTRRKFNSNTENNQVNLEHGQLSAPSSQNLGNLPMDSTPLPISDLIIPIAIQKGVRNCTKYPIAKYLSYQRL